MRGRRSELFADTSGTVMVMGLFLALFLGASVFLILSVGDAVLYRRTMQDGADAGAFAAAVVAAKGMNLHAFLNVSMAATAGVLLVIRSVEVLLEIVLAVLHAMLASLILAPKAAPLIAAITPAEAAVERVGDGVEQFVRVSHEALDVAHRAVQHGYPAIAEARAIDSMVLRGSFDPPVVGGFVLPVLGPALPQGRPGLPVEEASIGILCDRAANAVGGSIKNVQSAVPRWLMRFLGGAIERALQLGRRRTCADDVVKAPRAVLSSRNDSTEVWLGHDEFQYRSFGIGQSLDGGSWKTGERGLLINGGSPAKSYQQNSRLTQLARVSFAQAEYYHQSNADKPEWLWRSEWRARLRRFWVPRTNGIVGLRTACASVRGAQLDLSTLCTSISNLSALEPSAH